MEFGSPWFLTTISKTAVIQCYLSAIKDHYCQINSFIRIEDIKMGLVINIYANLQKHFKIIRNEFKRSKTED